MTAARGKYVLEDLLQVRRLREEAAARQVAQRKANIERLSGRVTQLQTDLAEYRNWKAAREEELFAEVKKRAIHRKDLDKFHSRVQKLREKEREYEANIVDAENQLRAEQEALVEDRAQYLAAHRNRDKLDEHKRGWLANARKLVEIAEEKEVEDFRNRQLDLLESGA